MGDEDQRSNLFNGAKLAGFLHEIDEADDELASLRGAYMRDCVAPRAKIKEALGRVKESGTNLVAFKEILEQHRTERQMRARVAELDLADKADFEAMRDALGPLFDTPLGKAAVAADANGDGQGRGDAEALARVGRGGDVLDSLG